MASLLSEESKGSGWVWRSNDARERASRLEPYFSNLGICWSTPAKCQGSTYDDQLNRYNAGYGADSRLTISAVVAFLFSLERKNLALSGR